MARGVFLYLFFFLITSATSAFGAPLDSSLMLPGELEATITPPSDSSRFAQLTFSWELPPDASLYASDPKYVLIFEQKLSGKKKFRQLAKAAVLDQMLLLKVNSSEDYTYRVRVFLGAGNKRDWKFSPYSAEFQPSGGSSAGPTPPAAWNRKFGTFTEGRSVVTDDNGNVILGGLTYDPFSMTVGGQTKSVQAGSFVVKYSITGVPLWVNALGSDFPSDPDIRVAADPWGDVVVAVEFAGSGHFEGMPGQLARGQDIMLIKYQGSDGRLLWHRKIGGGGNDGAHALLTDREGNLYVGGYFAAPSSPCIGQGVDFGAGELCGVGSGKGLAFLAKYNPNGNLLWVSTSFGASILDLALDGANHLVASSVTGSAPASCSQDLHGQTLALTRVSLTDGATSTVRSLPWPARRFNICNRGYPLAVAPNGDIILSGEFSGGLKLDDTAGSSPTVQTSTSLSRESFVVRYTASGRFVWGKKFGNLTGDPLNCQLAIASGLSLADNGDILITGFFSGLLEFSSTVKFDEDTSVGSGFFAVRYSGRGRALSLTDLGLNQSCTSFGSDILGLPGGYAVTTGTQDRSYDSRGFVSVYIP